MGLCVYICHHLPNDADAIIAASHLVPEIQGPLSEDVLPASCKRKPHLSDALSTTDSFSSAEGSHPFGVCTQSTKLQGL